MKVLLMPPLGANQFIRYPFLGLAYLATALRKSGSEVELFGFSKGDHSLVKFLSFLKKQNPDVVGISLYTKEFDQAAFTLEKIKRAAPHITTVIGGPHPSGEPYGALEDLKDADFGFHGEAEKGLPILLEELQRSTKKGFGVVPGLVWRSSGRVIVNEAFFEADLDSLGMPAWDLMPPENFPGTSFNFFYKSPFIAPISVTRGCPYKCTYCAAGKSNGRHVRKRSVSHVMKEIKYLYEQHGIREIQIMDSNFTFDRLLVRTFAKELIESGLQIYWSCPNGVRLDSLDEETLMLMKKSGCYLLNVGIETGSQKVMDSIKKALTVSEIENKIDLIKKAGIFVVGFFMFGFPDEQPGDIEKTLGLSYKLKLDGASYSIFSPLPGSAIYDSIQGVGEEKGFNWKNFDFGHDTGFRYPLPFAELKKIRSRAYVRFYMRPARFFRLLRYSCSFKRVGMMFRFAFRVIS
ncbi:MAG: B12-binding domain-containing radical SAM protein [Nitrospinota bacterium]